MFVTDPNALNGRFGKAAFRFYFPVHAFDKISQFFRITLHGISGRYLFGFGVSSYGDMPGATAAVLNAGLFKIHGKARFKGELVVKTGPSLDLYIRSGIIFPVCSYIILST